MTFDQILEQVGSYGCGVVELTGGEPLAHPGAFDLAARIVAEGYTLLVETSGAFDISGLPPEAHVIMDLKCPGSGESARNLWSNLEHLDHRDEVKFVVASLDDYIWARDTIREHGLEQRVAEGALAAVLLSPVVLPGSHEAPLIRRVADALLADRLQVRLQTQLHKVVWGPDVAGV